ncbi:centrin [Monocercomonoides exilis]|uniref:centrin n=1 Tax=Monocercomonoides exilis TaxID=2049356 RepID=UPI00355A212E|nr:centrin [Monocercomonoides exilis]|eukprot:MONOS_3823.1-p1 / transcript=MONOS_3823.1 / gene=MONOS_3823 / organism=Monocercomonoides_exilis_PA203 / gene_product=centrin / transcript_product=centrin / location=Mono_scaffold00094:28282-29403(-) / protein_length=212 / sequence_SO=supercontig / SO=protein_coding / is_pseudo=false
MSDFSFKESEEQSSSREPISGKTISRSGDSSGKKDEKKSKKGGRQQVTEVQREEIRRAFDCFDTDGSGSVNALTALKVTLTVLGFQPKKSDIKRLLAKERGDLVVDENTQLDFNTYLDIVTQMMGTPPPERELYKAFKQLGGSPTHPIGVAELGSVATNLGMDMTQEELEEMIFQTLRREDQQAVLQGRLALGKQTCGLEDFLKMMKKTGQC